MLNLFQHLHLVCFFTATNIIVFFFDVSRKILRPDENKPPFNGAKTGRRKQERQKCFINVKKVSVAVGEDKLVLCKGPVLYKITSKEQFLWKLPKKT